MFVFHATAVRLLLAFTMAGCALSPHRPTLEEEVERAEHARPDGPALARGDLRTTDQAETEMANLANRIEIAYGMGREVQPWVKRVQAAQRRYYLAASRLAGDPDLGYALARCGLAAGDAEGLGLVRRFAAARTAERQQRFAERRTYAYSVGDHGNSVFASAPFPREGVANPALTFRVTGTSPKIYMRTYPVADPEDLPARDGKVVVSIDVGIAEKYELTVPRPRSWNHEHRELDFVLENTGQGTGALVDARQPFANLQVVVEYQYYKDNIVVIDKDGVARVRKEYARVQLASSPLFWERGD